MSKTAKNLKEETSDSSKISELKNLPVDESKIAEMAYYKSESRGFTPGYELEDWLQAEEELNLS